MDRARQRRLACIGAHKHDVWLTPPPRSHHCTEPGRITYEPRPVAVGDAPEVPLVGPAPARSRVPKSCRALASAAHAGRGCRSRRSSSFLASSAQRTTLARPTQISQSSSPSGVVSNASLRKRQLHDRDLEQGRERDRAPEQPVREEPVEGARAVGARVEAVEELGEHEGRERHRPRLDDVPGAADDPARQAEVERERASPPPSRRRPRRCRPTSRRR